MNIYIMTRGRVGKQETLKHIPRSWLSSTFLVCGADEAAEHTHQSIVVPKEVTNYSQKFQWILDGNAGANPRFVIMDDDLYFSRRVPGTQKLVRATGDELIPMLEQFEDLLEHTALLGIHPRQMGHLAKLPYVENGKIICVQGINQALLPSPIPRVDQFPILADVILNCTLLSQGIGNKLLTTYTQDHGSCQAPGGCSLYRTPEMQREAVEWVAATFAPHAKAVTKRPKSAKWMGDERTDLRVQWKKMYRDGGGK